MRLVHLLVLAASALAMSSPGPSDPMAALARRDDPVCNCTYNPTTLPIYPTVNPYNPFPDQPRPANLPAYKWCLGQEEWLPAIVAGLSAYAVDGLGAIWAQALGEGINTAVGCATLAPAFSQKGITLLISQQIDVAAYRADPTWWLANVMTGFADPTSEPSWGEGNISLGRTVTVWSGKQYTLGRYGGPMIQTVPNMLPHAPRTMVEWPDVVISPPDERNVIAQIVRFWM